MKIIIFHSISKFTCALPCFLNLLCVAEIPRVLTTILTARVYSLVYTIPQTRVTNCVLI